MQELLEKLKREDRLKFLLFKLDFNEYYKGISEYKFFDVDLDKYLISLSLDLLECVYQSKTRILVHAYKARNKSQIIVQ